ncbi:MAG: anti-sigma factor antagonist [Ilumatobacteraceae bacterium]|nr:anti-sigma factor antagonist [Ilumatobacteraceae bacterium]
MSDRSSGIDGFDEDSVEPPFSYHRDGAGRIVVIGDIDLASAQAFKPVLLASRDPIELDLSGVGFMDSSGVKVLLQARRVRAVRIAVASPAVSRVLELLGLSDSFAADPR